jgi:hypothetical protein
MPQSPQAAAGLLALVENGDLTPFDAEADDVMGTTDCDRGCHIEPDGRCTHGYTSAAVTAGLI